MVKQLHDVSIIIIIIIISKSYIAHIPFNKVLKALSLYIYTER